MRYLSNVLFARLPIGFFVVVAFLFLSASVTTAQTVDNDDDTFQSRLFPKKAIADLSLGAFGGTGSNHHIIDMSYAIDMKYTDMSGFTAGITASRHLTGWFSLRADFALVQKNYRMDRDNSYVSFVYTESTNNYLSLPVTAVVSLGRTFRVCGFFGGYTGYWLSGRREGLSLSVPTLVVGRNEDNAFDESYEFDSRRDNRFDAGLVYGFGIRCAVVRKLDISAEMRWYYGLTDIQKNYMTNLNPRYNTTRALQFGLSYWL